MIKPNDCTSLLLPSAGMLNNDVIISINDQSVHTTEDVSEAVQAGQPLSVMVRRANEDVMLTVVPKDID